VAPAPAVAGPGLAGFPLGDFAFLLAIGVHL
jgi:hypothetical protein